MRTVPVRPNRESTPRGWRFYDPEQQNLANEEPLDMVRYRAVLRKQRRLRERYLRHLSSLRNRLANSTYTRFTADAPPLFDSNLLEFSVGDALGKFEPRARWRPKTTIEADLLSFDMKTIHTLHYTDVDSLLFEMPHERWFNSFDQARRGIDSLIHDELTAAGKLSMQHGFLFVSGTTIRIIFRSIRWTTKRLLR
jgi:hypothetical protein